ncbi:tRNA-Thr(GGU) m(6)t(6)A37 methyltransferase TsaA [Malonomonas rubra DSM 5091]|uniref:tRNA-Thr(GGU) m(6)t(6)A37 methyltransferase TsaA n=1 Tax=Malonomonas rubra DSM 5091 TaxID=1122189 RepID=A0A1M6N311_MALRU|nr:tRNA (N6-threonylcarbamoyladenosine(37)-N6)-methyltransferase TrmO [Malonomonas rubra]SHJ90120.1 tRNA-Thr(GGU) m(6)t(6)A37 methyltransferase TsaA [Malonomonas rubra DSM 5091]
MQIEPIGVIHSPFHQIAEMPIQPGGAKGEIGRIELNPELVEGLSDLAGFSHIIVLYHFHRVEKNSLTVTPFLDPEPRGVFATRAPTRPNHIGLSVLKLQKIEGNILTVESIDILDGTPVLDIKPYLPEFDQPEGEITTGWMQQGHEGVKNARSDKRFA